MEKSKLQEDLEKELKEIKDRLSSLRKKGADVKLAEMRLMVVPAKINIAMLTQDPKDVEKIRKIYEAARMELDDSKKEMASKREHTKGFYPEKTRIDSEALDLEKDKK